MIEWYYLFNSNKRNFLDMIQNGSCSIVDKRSMKNRELQFEEGIG